MDLDKCIKQRCSCRKFKSKKPDWRKIIEAIEAASRAPLAGNIPTVKFILVSDEDKIKELSEAAAQSFLSSVHYIIAVVSDQKQCIASYDERGERYCKQQAGAAIENLLLKLEDLGLASCWIGAFADEQVKKILQLPTDTEPEGLLPVGYAMQKGKQRAKPDLDHCLYFDFWKNKTMTPIKKVEAV